MRFWRRKQSSPKPNLPPFHPDTVIRDLGNGDTFTLADAQTGTLIVGATGSGKTSGPAKFLAHGFLANGFGGLVLTAKKDERPQWEQWAADCGRENDLVIINAEGDVRFNFMDWEASKDSGAFTINVVALLDETQRAIAGGDKEGGSGENKVWEDALHTLNMNAVDLPVLAGLHVSIPLLRDITSSAPLTLDQVNDPAFRKESLCLQILEEADKATKDGDPEARADFEECRTYWTRDYPSYSDKVQSSIMLGFTSLIRPLVTRPLRKILSSDTTITPEAMFDGKIIIVDLPVQEYKLAGRIANLIVKHCAQSSILRRVQPADRRSFLRPVFIYADEAQNFIVRGDSEYQAVARSAGGCTCYITQNRESLVRVLKSEAAVDSLLNNLQAKFICQGTGDTNYWAARLLGERYVNITSSNAGLSGNDRMLQMQQAQQAGYNAGISQHEERRFFIEPATITTLRRGGPQHNYLVDANFFLGGHLFENANGERLPYKQITFTQK